MLEIKNATFHLNGVAIGQHIRFKMSAEKISGYRVQIAGEVTYPYYKTNVPLKEGTWYDIDLSKSFAYIPVGPPKLIYEGLAKCVDAGRGWATFTGREDFWLEVLGKPVKPGGMYKITLTEHGWKFEEHNDTMIERHPDATFWCGNEYLGTHIRVLIQDKNDDYYSVLRNGKPYVLKSNMYFQEGQWYEIHGETAVKINPPITWPARFTCMTAEHGFAIGYYISNVAGNDTPPIPGWVESDKPLIPHQTYQIKNGAVMPHPQTRLYVNDGEFWRSHGETSFPLGPIIRVRQYKSNRMRLGEKVYDFDKLPPNFPAAPGQYKWQEIYASDFSWNEVPHPIRSIPKAGIEATVLKSADTFLITDKGWFPTTEKHIADTRIRIERGTHSLDYKITSLDRDHDEIQIRGQFFFLPGTICRYATLYAEIIADVGDSIQLRFPDGDQYWLKTDDKYRPNKGGHYEIRLDGERRLRFTECLPRIISTNNGFLVTNGPRNTTVLDIEVVGYQGNMAIVRWNKTNYQIDLGGIKKPGAGRYQMVWRTRTPIEFNRLSHWNYTTFMPHQAEHRIHRIRTEIRREFTATFGKDGLSVL